ncbi:MAG: protein kinase [Deltaproteobacteria bacterium]|nr:protein kinase [Deltaproteobacteria bacterium]
MSGDSEQLVGQTLDERYSVGPLLHHGRTGAIYRATHLALGRDVAVTVVHAPISNDSQRIAQFRKECAAAGQIKSPHAVTISDFGKLDDGRIYYVTELMEGESLEVLLTRQGTFGEEETVDILAQLEDALGDMHSRQLPYRNLDAAALYMDQLRDRQIVRLMALGSGALSDPNWRAAAYLPPEPDAEPIVADNYAAAVLAYRMLYGVMPSRDDDGALLVPSSRTISPHVVAAISGALAPDPSMRPRTLRVFVDQLAGHQIASPRQQVVLMPDGSQPTSDTSAVEREETVVAAARGASDDGNTGDHTAVRASSGPRDPAAQAQRVDRISAESISQAFTAEEADETPTLARELNSDVRTIEPPPATHNQVAIGIAPLSNDHPAVAPGAVSGELETYVPPRQATASGELLTAGPSPASRTEPTVVPEPQQTADATGSPTIAIDPHEPTLVPAERVVHAPEQRDQPRVKATDSSAADQSAATAPPRVANEILLRNAATERLAPPASKTPLLIGIVIACAIAGVVWFLLR